MEEITVHIEEADQKGRAYIGSKENVIAEMTFSKAGNSMMIIDHTEVDESLRGKGAGRKMLDALVKLARERKINILPLCPYAKSVFDKDPAIRDVLR